MRLRTWLATPLALLATLGALSAALASNAPSTQPDGLRALARHAGLETVEAWTQWEDRPQYDSESNKWHDSILVARKGPEKLSTRWRRSLERRFVR